MADAIAHDEARAAVPTPRLSRAVATVAAVGIGLGVAVLVVFNLLVAALTCGDDGPLDYGTGGAAVERYCRISFEEHLDGTSHHSATFSLLCVIALGAGVAAGAALAITRRRGWLYAALTLLGLLAALTFMVLAVV